MIATRWYNRVALRVNVEISIEALIADHRELEAPLDRLAASVAYQKVDADAFRDAWAACIRHYRREEGLLDRLSARLAAKLRGQHAEAVEVAERLDEALAAGHASDAMYLARRFIAIVQHNIIEEERDAFPFAGRAS